MNDADRKLLPLLAGWLDGELSPEDARRIEAALERSEELRAVLAEWRTNDEALSAGEPVRSDVEWEALAQRVENAIETPTEPMRAASVHDGAHASVANHRRRTWFANPRWALGGGGALAAALVLLFVSLNHESILKSARVGERPPVTQIPLGPPPSGGEPSAADPGTHSAPAATKEAPERKADLPVTKKTSNAKDVVSSPQLGAVGKSSDVTAGNEALKKEGAATESAESAAKLRLEADAQEPTLDLTRPQPPVTQSPSLLPQEINVRGGRSGDVSVRIQSTQPQEKAATRQAPSPQPADKPLPASPQLAPPPPAPTPLAREGLATAYALSGAPETSWTSDAETDLRKAVADQNADDLRRTLDVIEQHRATEDAAAPDPATLGLSLRARCELQRLAPGDASSCDAIRADYATWQQHADAVLQNSDDGLRLRDLVGEVCPQ